MRILGKFKTNELDIKRFYLPGLILKTKCPGCGNSVGVDFGIDYLSYPPVGEVWEHGLWCGNCDHEWSEKLILNITLKVVRGKD